MSLAHAHKPARARSAHLQQPGSRQYGFTLVELIVTVTVIGVLATLAVPSFTKSVEKRRLVAAAEAVYDQVQFARTESLKQARDLLVDATTDGSTGWCVGISANTGGCNCSTTGSCVITQGTTGNIEKTLKSENFTNVRMTNSSFECVFNRLRGTLEGATQTFVLKSPSDMEIRVTVSALGVVRVCSPTGAHNVGGYPGC
ncbi:GspH/FimT family pseudopilin [Parasulfuritortus cantonensis]|uniref:GspH/FimT family pseudopilin n=1 Tax=Parasulfuritortus cantonensis TaxID=2528202 RepID=UPI0023EA6BB1|nr:GspH/FimT family pseudopilin [Parasulfuritortus cantonensis]